MSGSPTVSCAACDPWIKVVAARSMHGKSEFVPHDQEVMTF